MLAQIILSHPVLCGALVLPSFLALVFVHRFFIRTLSTSDLRGPVSTSFLTGNFLDFAKADAGVQLDCYLREFGNISRHTGLLGAEKVLIADHRAINHIFSHPDAFPKLYAVRKLLTRILGEGVLVAQGHTHLRQRKVMLPSFSNSSVRDLCSIFLEVAYELRDKILQLSNQSDTVDMYHWWGRGTLDVIGKAGFDYSFNSTQNDENELAQAFSAMFKTGSEFSIFQLLQTFFPVLSIVPTRSGKAIAKSLALMRDASRGIVRQKKSMLEAFIRSNGEMLKEDFESRDLISQLIRANIAADLPDSQRLSDEEVANQISTFLLAGFETSSTSLSWITEALATHQDAQDKLREELLGVKSDMPSMEELNALPYLDAVVKEGLRLHSAVPETCRVVAHSTVIPLSAPFTDKNGREHRSLHIDAGTEIIIPIVSIQRSEEVWGKDAAEFKPERWLSDLPDATKTLEVPWARLLTFIAGPRSCIGHRFAVVEIKALLFVVLRSLRFSHPSPRPEYWHRTVIVQRPQIRGKEDEGFQLQIQVRPVSSSCEEQGGQA